ncbi:MAG TPA: Nif3-like dinuclear metal center hexameric protein [Chitinophagaceae bacterium]|jgi:putative NIF3 family GTP cyclohydrolase 1 type 2|nr:Nif3-like dinuclear metal center hexameric protein [Chitinophagaceae bacterium]
MNDFKSKVQRHDLNRRKFIETGMKAVGSAALLTIPATHLFAANKEYTIQDVIDLTLKEIPGTPFKQTVDTLKSGSADQKVTGIVTTMFATIEVIKKAAALNANFIIAHEPTFYNHTDDINWVENNMVVKLKQELLKQHNIAVWRFHDYWHAYRPDGISYGVLKKANWLQYNKNADISFKIPATSLKYIVEHLKTSLGIAQVRVIGDLSQSCSTIALLPGAWGGQKQIATVEKEKPDVLIVGEVHEWETAEYIRDARMLGSKTSLIVLSHSVSEEPGMEWLVEWLQPKLQGIKVKHIASNNPFTMV